ncbi:MAG TPA: hypothetical protein VEJ63_07460 [Planctomycetota bacterium]|nr:hypothetical protein [Planctomycetota bacterium]
MPQPIVRLRIVERAGVARNFEPVTSGVPLPESLAISDVSRLRLTDSSNRDVPAQFRVLSRWGDLSDQRAPIRWVLIDTQISVASHGSASLTLCRDEPREALLGISVSEDAEAIRIDTGAALFQFSRTRGNLFESVTLGGADLVTPATENGFVVTALDGHVFSSAFARPKECRIEERGPLRCVVLIRGEFHDSDGKPWMGGNTSPEWRNEPLTPELEKTYDWGAGVFHETNNQKQQYDKRWWCWRFDTEPEKQIRPIEYTLRIHLYHGRADAKVDFTLENNGDALRFLIKHFSVGINDVAFKSLEAHLAVNVDPQSAEIEGVAVDPTKGLAEVTQYHCVNNPKNEAENFSYEVAQNGNVQARGGRALGWAQIAGNRGSASQAFDYFWQVFPKSSGIDGNRLIAGLFPEYKRPDEWGESIHVFANGWHKTHSLLYSFSNESQSMSHAEESARRFAAPLFLSAEPHSWYADSGAWGLVGPEGLRVDDTPLQEALGRYEQERRTLVDASLSADGSSLPQLREHQIGCYGWQYFGTFLKEQDVRCSASHYDWPYAAWLHFIRTGDQRFVEQGLILTRHCIDLDQFHLSDDRWHDGMWQWEGVGSHYPGKRPFHAATVREDGPYTHVLGAAQCYTHTWSAGFALGYLLTGDQRYFEALHRTLEGSRYWWWEYMKLKDGKPVPYDQTRSQGWCILHHLNMYRITGAKRHIEDAITIFSLSLLHSEHERTGAWPVYGPDGAWVVQTFYIYPIEPCLELHYWADKAGLDTRELAAFLRRWCDYAHAHFYAKPERLSDGKYLPWRNQYMIRVEDKVDPKKAGCLRFHTMSCSAFAYVGWLLRESDPKAAEHYTRVGHELFRDHYLYTPQNLKATPEGPTPVDPSSRYPIKFLYSVQDQLEKEQGWAFRGSQALLWTLAQGSQSFSPSR